MSAATEPETVVACYPLEGATVKLGPFDRSQLFLCVLSTGRVSVRYALDDPGIIIELQSVGPFADLDTVRHG